MSTLLLDVQVEYKSNVLGMDEARPRFSYRLPGTASQKAYQIEVRENGGKVVWNSGRVESAANCQISYDGESLQPFTRYDYTITSFGIDGQKFVSPAETYFETGFLNTPWHGQWVSGATELNNRWFVQRVFCDFEVKKPVAKARLYATSLGVYEPWLNGKRVSDDCLTPGWTNYFERVQYQAYDVTTLLQNGDNRLGIWLGDGYYKGVISRIWNQGRPTYGEFAMLRAELQLTYADGSKEIIGSDPEHFKYITMSSLRLSDIYMGEQCEAWREDDWLLPGGRYLWWADKVKSQNPAVQIVWNSGAKVHKMGERLPVKIVKRAPGTFVVDFGQNLTGRELLHLVNPVAGATIFIKHGEMLNADGSLYYDNLRTATAQTVYTCAGREVEDYEPKFTYYGFRYVEISGWPYEEMTPEAIKVAVLYSDLAKTGDFECSNPLLNKLYSNIVWGQRGNFLDVPTDCPQRDERLGWTADTQVFTNVASYNMACGDFYTKYIIDLNSCLSREGDYADFVPYPYMERDDRRFTGASGWADAGVVCPWVMLNKYADRRLVQKYLPNICRWLDVQVERAGGKFVVKNARFGDWLNLDAPTPEEYISTAYLAGMTALTIKMARLVGQQEVALERERKFAEIQKAFLAEFFTADGELKVKTQTAASMGIAFGLVSGDWKRKTGEFLVQDILKRDTHISSGFLGTPLVLPVLTELGQVDLAYKLLEQTTYPGWLYPVTQGATTMWERWNSWTEKDGFGDVGMNSFNHYAYGAVGEWFFETICGIVPLAATPDDLGLRHFKLAPQVGHSLTDAKAEYCSTCGWIKSAWQRRDGKLFWQFTVPANSTAELVLPGKLTTELPAGIIGAAESKLTAMPGQYELVLTDN